MERMQKKEKLKAITGMNSMQMEKVVGNQSAVMLWNGGNSTDVVQCLRIINLDADDEVLKDSEERLRGYREDTTEDGSLEPTEDIVIICHGGDPREWGKFVVFGSGDKEFSPEQLAGEICHLLPNGYRGEIFINGCYTSTLYQRSTFVSQFNQALRGIMERSGSNYFGRVKGNDGAVLTTRSGRDSVTPSRYGE